MFKRLKQFLIGKPLENEASGGQKYNVLFGLPILASDAISSIAYASEEILIILVPALGILAYRYLSFISASIILLLLILTFSYQQIIRTYPNGGGSFIVASDNLGPKVGLVAGASLSIDYILTVAVSLSSGTEAITSAFPSLFPYRILICLVILALIMLGNLRGIKESSRLFSIPTYAFFFVMVITIVTGLIKFFLYGAPISSAQEASLPNVVEKASLLLILSAFSNGCAALTGVEAVSNAIPNFKEPSVKNARKVLYLLSFFVMLLFGGVSLLANIYHAIPAENNTVLSQIVESIYGKSFMYYLVQILTAVILLMAANTSYSGFPLLMSLISKEGYAPRQLSQIGDRLSYSNGILVLSAVAAVLLVIFRANTNALIPLYAIGVFISFTLSQFGMLKRWITHREGHWVHKALINGMGALVTAIVVLIISITKFHKGAWIVIIVLPVLVLCMLRIKQHYISIAKQLKLSADDLKNINIEQNAYRNRVIVPIDSINKSSVRALRYASTISDNVVAFNVSIDRERGEKLKNSYSLLQTKIPLYIKYSPYRKIIDPLLDFIDSEEYNYKKGDIVTVVIPEFIVSKSWQKILHNRSGKDINQRLLKYKHIVIATMPLQLKDEGLLFRQK